MSLSEEGALSIGVDVGGSFTDAVVSVSDRTVRAKAAEVLPT